MHGVLLRESAPDIVGRLREYPVLIGGHDLYPCDTSFMPHHHAHIPAAMVELEAFDARRDLPILFHAALDHA